jgi:hypothetical protein
MSEFAEPALRITANPEVTAIFANTLPRRIITSGLATILPLLNESR